jgi:hypothetical protein
METLSTDELLTLATPRPWHTGGIPGGGRGPIVYALDGYAIADTKTFHGRHLADKTTELHEVHAELITRAVNSFAAMREALKGMLQHAPAPSKNVRKEFHYLVARRAADDALRLADAVEQIEELTLAEKYPLTDWQDEVRAGDTRLGYEEWVQHRKEAEEATEGKEVQS